MKIMSGKGIMDFYYLQPKKWKKSLINYFFAKFTIFYQIWWNLKILHTFFKEKMKILNFLFSEVFEKQEIFEKNSAYHSCLIFFCIKTAVIKKFCATFFRNFFLKNNFFSILLHIILDFDNDMMKNALSMAIHSLKKKITQDLKKCPYLDN